MSAANHRRGRRLRSGPFNRIHKLALASLVSAIASAALADDFKWRKVADVPFVVITAREVSRGEMSRLARQYGEHGGAYQREGFAILRRKADGSYACDVFVRDLTDEHVMAHESRHCHGWAHY